ncbi:T6SS immunity protein Tdi1 domain-containing protein [Nocardia yamanashiensis]|uniref:T6SS immunity protein Tdi1 domain-containing protein n=1 Tax=Nocardia yamanashiensis TaxID=209247 RepID=UPI000B13748A|nr:T6SS immunity protein Tdi1 domain-containing protein [Nocardia yamanashiensis]
MDLIRVFSPEQYDVALESWSWLVTGGQDPWCATAFGDILFGSAEGIWILDLVTGTYEWTWPTPQAAQADLDTIEGQDRYLLAALAQGAERRGLILGPDEVYAFTLPPKAGGELTVENIRVMDFALYANLLGQMHAQLRDKPTGFTMTGFELSGLD